MPQQIPLKFVENEVWRSRRDLESIKMKWLWYKISKFSLVDKFWGVQLKLTRRI